MIAKIRIGESSKDAVDAVSKRYQSIGAIPQVNRGSAYILVDAAGGIPETLDPEDLMAIDGVESAFRITGPYKLASRIPNDGNGNSVERQDTIFSVGGQDDVTARKVGGKDLIYILGPCAAESRDQVMQIADELATVSDELGIKDQVIFRAGLWKPRSEPYTFQGAGYAGLPWLAEVREQFGLPVMAEITSPEQFEGCHDALDAFWTGAKNMDNSSLLKAAGYQGGINRKPVFIKNSNAPNYNLEDWLIAAEYAASKGLNEIALIERGTDTPRTHTRNLLDYSALAALPRMTHYPAMIDPSHGTGNPALIGKAAEAGVLFGARGLMLEVLAEGTNRSQVLCDGKQGLYIKSQLPPIIHAVQYPSDIYGSDIKRPYE